MNGRTGCLNFYTEFITVFNDLRFIKRYLILIGRHHPITFDSHHIHCIQHLCVFMLHNGKILQLTDELIFIRYGFSNHFRQHFIVIRFFHIQRNAYNAVRQAYSIRLTALYVLAFQCYGIFQYIPNGSVIFHQKFYLIDHINLHTIIQRQHFHPFGHIKLNGRNWKLIKYILKQHMNIFFFELLTIYGHG